MKQYKNIVDNYLLYNKNENKAFNNLYAQLKKDDDKYLINRKNFTGHFTASAFVISKKSKKVLMVHHKTIKKLLQPGGQYRINR